MRSRLRLAFFALVKIEIELRPDNRFLSLVVSDAGDGIDHDWVIFAQPMLEVQP